MRFLGPEDDRYAVELAPEEKALLLHLLSLYPLVPESYHRLTKDKKLPKRGENQQLLDEALRAQRQENRRQLLTFISDTERFVKTGARHRVSFTRGELEWLLQVVNDVRVGCWIALGSPGYDEKKKPKPDKEAMRHAMFMEVAGAFEMFFLGIVNGDVLPEAED